jgi:hypothetical protein
LLTPRGGRRVERRHGVEAQQIEPGHAEMHPFDSPIVKARHAKSATIANTTAEDLVRVPQVIAVLPNNRRHVPEVMRLCLA